MRLPKLTSAQRSQMQRHRTTHCPMVTFIQTEMLSHRSRHLPCSSMAGLWMKSLQLLRHRARPSRSRSWLMETFRHLTERKRSAKSSSTQLKGKERGERGKRPRRSHEGRHHSFPHFSIIHSALYHNDMDASYIGTWIGYLRICPKTV